ncbi:hypothetical protein GPECTOR_64g108 [Gonium pectorale]|uniref:Uncharacterized protein n=1 Tax=Gonium pectorale TaxID=33097 RepID=A0A150G460_GONPE|nr:hypothetical protein GPECTOR_64g108 [Gonium pectorale]|eukprot:KXZ44614.1 hypothetical protein GPECTOR_64g108 [Gonium pectorale]
MDPSGGGGGAGEQGPAARWPPACDAWLREVACEATPSGVTLDSGLGTDAAVAGGRAVVYGGTSLLVIGGSGGGDGVAVAEYDSMLSTYGIGPARHGGCNDNGDADGDEDDVGRRRRGGGGRGMAASSGPPGSEHPSLLPDCSKLHAASALAPLRGPVRLLRCGQGFKAAATSVQVPPLEREAVRLLAGRAAELPAEQLPAAVAAWGEVVRLGLLDGSREHGGGAAQCLRSRLTA